MQTVTTGDANILSPRILVILNNSSIRTNIHALDEINVLMPFELSLVVDLSCSTVVSMLNLEIKHGLASLKRRTSDFRLLVLLAN